MNVGQNKSVPVPEKNEDIHPQIHTFPIKHKLEHVINSACLSSNNSQSSENPMNSPNPQPHLIIIPCEDEDGSHKEVLQQVYAYPRGSITTIIEKAGHKKIEKEDAYLTVVDSKPEDQFLIQKKGKNFHGSFSSISSSLSTEFGQRKSTRLKNKTFNVDTQFPITRVPLYLQPNLTSSFFFDMSSDTSSNFSNESDLSGYENEYSTIRKIVSDAPNYQSDKALALCHPPNKLSQASAKMNELQSLVKSLENSKEDLEIEVHRLSAQLQNSIKDKDYNEEQIELLQTKLLETEQLEKFKILKEKVSLEGQYKALKQEYDHISMEKNSLHLKILDLRSVIDKNLENLDILSKSNQCLQEEVQSVVSKHTEKDSSNSELQRKLDNEKFNLKLSLEEVQKSIIQKEMRIDQQETEISSLHHSIDNLHKELSDYRSNKENLLGIICGLEKQLDNQVSKCKSHYNELKWCQQQLENCQEEQLKMQEEFKNSKSALVAKSSETDLLTKKIEQLNSIIEENKVQALREKSSLLLHLEELEAETKKREATLRLQDEDNVNYIKISAERMKKLEEDQKKLQALVIEHSDLQRENKSLNEELKHEQSNVNKLETKIQNAIKEVTVLEDKIYQKDAFAAALNSQMADIKSKLEIAFTNEVEKNKNIDELKETKWQLEAKLKNASEDKTKVDNSICKLKEDMNKLSTNYYRMKHDISVKDRLIETLTSSNLDLVQNESNFKSEYKTLRLEKDTFSTKIAELETELSELSSKLSDMEANEQKHVFELAEYENSICSQNIIKENLSQEIKIRDEQISNLQLTIKGYKEKLLIKDEEVYSTKCHSNTLEKNMSSLQSKFNEMIQDLNKLKDDKEELIETEANFKRTVKDLKESLKLEKGGKEINEKKLNNLREEYKKREESFKIELNALHSEHSKQIEALKNSLELSELKCQEHLSSIKEQINEVELRRELSMEKGPLKQITKTNHVSSTYEEYHVNEKLLEKVNSKPKPSKEFKTSSDKVKSDLATSESSEKYNIEKTLREEIEQLKITVNKLKYDESKHDLIAIENMKLKESLDEINIKLNLSESYFKEVEKTLQDKENKCLEWKAKCESLSDLIPQRDTSLQVAIPLSSAFNNNSNNQLKFPSYTNLRDNLSSYSDDSCSMSENSLMRSSNQFHCAKEMSLNLPFHAEATGGDNNLGSGNGSSALLSQINVGVQTLDSRHVNENSPQDCNISSSCEIFPLTIKVSDTSSELDKNNSTRLLTKHVEDQKSEISSLNLKIQELHTDFDSKTKRYQSNIRLLTRKLKEHMKGRRGAEKELEMKNQNTQNTIDQNKEHHERVLEKYIDAEKKLQDQELCVKSLTEDLRKKSQALEMSENRIVSLQQANLDQERRDGQILELKSLLEASKCQEKSLETTIHLKIQAEEEIVSALQKRKEEVESLRKEMSELSLQNEEKERSLCNFKKEVGIKEDEINSMQKSHSLKHQELESLKKMFSDLQTTLKKTEEHFTEFKTSSVEEINSLNNKIEHFTQDLEAKDNLRGDMELKIEVLNNKILLLENSLTASRTESERLELQVQVSSSDYSFSLETLQARLDKARRIEGELHEQLRNVSMQNSSLQDQITELKSALNAALHQIERMKVPLCIDISAPPPLDTESITKLIEKCSQTSRSNKSLSLLSEKLNLMRKDISHLKQEMEKTENKELNGVNNSS